MRECYLAALKTKSAPIFKYFVILRTCSPGSVGFDVLPIRGLVIRYRILEPRFDCTFGGHANKLVKF